MSANGPRLVATAVMGATTLTMYRLYRSNQPQVNPTGAITEPKATRSDDILRYFPRK